MCSDHFYSRETFWHYVMKTLFLNYLPRIWSGSVLQIPIDISLKCVFFRLIFPKSLYFENTILNILLIIMVQNNQIFVI